MVGVKRFTMLFAVAMLAMSSLRAAEEYKVDDEGFVKNWLLLVPIHFEDSTGADEIDKQQVADEAKLSPAEGEKVKVKDKELAWKKVATKDYFFDINEILGNPTENAVAYAVCNIVADADMKDLKLQMGSNDQGKVYLNGKEVVKFAETRTLEKDQNAAEGVTLNKGANKIVFKVINEGNNFQGCIRFTDKAGAAIKTLKVTLGK
jgi:hypothetical protein